MSSTLSNQLESLVEEATDERVDLKIRVLDSAGANSSESLLGADLCAVLDIEVAPQVRVRKGFLVQAKRSGYSGLTYTPPNQASKEYSHWLWRPDALMDESGVVALTTPPKLLATQCRDMLNATPTSFVWIYGSHPVAVVGAKPILELYARPRRSPPIELGTKRLDDFMVNALDCFIGDPAIIAWDTESLLQQCFLRRARFGALFTVDLPRRLGED